MPRQPPHLLATVASLALLGGCGPQLNGTWDITRWAVTTTDADTGEGVEAEVLGETGDAGWIVLVEQPRQPFGLLRYFWNDEEATFRPFQEPLLVQYSGDADQADEEDWRLEGGEVVGDFRVQLLRSSRVELVAEDWPLGRRSVWYLERR